MAFSIGLRIYKIEIQPDGGKGALPLTRDQSTSDLYQFFSDFIASHGASNDRDDIQRSWDIEPPKDNSVNYLRGFINYGTFGFRSKFRDRKTKKSKYQRQVNDVEEIPLYYQFWFPDKVNYAFLALQSFQTRSCVTLVLKTSTEFFRARNSNRRLSFKKLMPEDLKGSAFYSSPVKKVTLIRKSVPSDVPDQYLNGTSRSEAEYQVSIVAKRRRKLGTLFDFMKKETAKDTSLLEFDGETFDEASVEIAVGNKRRKIGVLGFNSDAGVIELGESVTIGPEGHPTYESMKKETDTIMADFFKTLREK
ncbi:hypothetical protein QBK99_21000 [Corticibacterium sp. UT-5YL-CI-8]|nr:hypothetical protein [Tianweitania sp. UT-5YL-CI-8]